MSARIACARSRNKGHGVALDHRRQVELGLAGDSQRLPAGRDDPERGRGREQLGDRPGRVGQQLLEVVEHHMGLLVAEAGGDRGGRVSRGAEVRGDQRNDQRRIPNRGQRDEDGPAVRLVGQESRQLDREPCLAGAAGADDGEKPRVALEPQRCRVEELALAAEKVRRGSGEVDGAGRPQRWERRVPSWNSCAGASKSFSRWRPRSRRG